MVIRHDDVDPELSREFDFPGRGGTVVDRDDQGYTVRGELAYRLLAQTVPVDETAGQALDIDGDGTLDNALAPIGSFVNESIAASITDGSLLILLEFLDFAPGPFTLALLTSELDPANAGCDTQAATCDYWADPSSLAPVSCERTITLPATRSGTLVTAGSPTTVVPLSILKCRFRYATCHGKGW